MKGKLIKIVVFGLLAWLIPMIVSFFFYSREGTLLIDVFLFKSIMIVVGTLIASYFLVAYFSRVTKNYLGEAVLIGSVWAAMNLILDLIFLVPMSKLSLIEYMQQIGMRYFVILIFSVAMGIALENNVKKHLRKVN